MADDVLRVLAERRAESGILVGHSLGGMVAMAVAARSRQGRGLILFEGWTSLDVMGRVFDSGTHMYGHLPASAIAAINQKSATTRARVPPAAWDCFWQSVEAFDGWPCLTETRRPVLEVYGDAGRRDGSREALRIPQNPAITVEWVKGAGHYLPHERPAETAALTAISAAAAPATLANGVTEYRLRGAFAAAPALALELVFRLAPDSPVVRFQYRLISAGPCPLTRTAGNDALRYLGVLLADLPLCKEVRFSEFDESVHSFRLTEHAVTPRQFEDHVRLMGPMLVAADAEHAVLLAYEHGSQVPDAFVEYRLSPGRGVTLEAVKGNYCAGETLDAAHPFETIWFQFAAVKGTEDALAAEYRRFVLHYFTLNAASPSFSTTPGAIRNATNGGTARPTWTA